MEPLLKELGITYFSTRLTSKKAALVERFNRMLKDKMWRYLNYEGTREWLDVLPALVQNINTSVNRTLGIAPADVSHENEVLVRTKLYGWPHDLEGPKFHRGDKVRVAKYVTAIRVREKGPFLCGFKSNFTREIYEVSKVWIGMPNMY